LDQAGNQQHAWTTSWGVSTRLIGGVIMTHSDDDGLILPPRVAPRQVVIIPIFRNDDERAKVLAYCTSLKSELQAIRYWDHPLAVELDARDIRGGEKTWQYIKKGVPIRLEIGPRDMESDSVFMGRRDLPHKEKSGIKRQAFIETVTQILDEIHQNLVNRARSLRESNTIEVNELGEFKKFFTPQNESKPEIHAGFALAHWAGGPEVDAILKDLKVSARCIPLDGKKEAGKCIFTGRPSSQRVIFAKSY
jgi:prolyl-tRNA synthetase